MALATLPFGPASNLSTLEPCTNSTSGASVFSVSIVLPPCAFSNNTSLTFPSEEGHLPSEGLNRTGHGRDRVLKEQILPGQVPIRRTHSVIFFYNIISTESRTVPLNETATTSISTQDHTLAGPSYLDQFQREISYDRNLQTLILTVINLAPRPSYSLW
jgi:hypothetical protein